MGIFLYFYGFLCGLKVFFPVFGPVFLDCERDWLAKQSNERIPKMRWKFTYERSPVFTHGCIFTFFRIVFLYYMFSFKTGSI